MSTREGTNHRLFSDSQADCERIIERFEEAWQRGQRPPIGDFLPPNASERSSLLIELVHVDLEFGLKSEHTVRVEHYLAQYPELAEHDSVVVDLLAAEWQLRRRYETNVSLDEYGRRFPQYADRLRPLLRAEPGQGKPLADAEAKGLALPGTMLYAQQSTPLDLHAAVLSTARTLPFQKPGSTPELPTVTGYDVVGVLGHGGMGVVYQAWQQRPRRLVALKMLLPRPQAHADSVARFHAEAEAVAQLQHPNIVQIYEVDEDQGRPFFSMEFAEGGSLAQQLTAAPLSASQAAQLVQVLARAIHVAHQRGIIHRDLKPANVLLTADGTPKISDFGLAKQLDDDSGQTRSGAIMGTPSYMAPEQASGRIGEIGAETDVYALGAILYETVTGRPPFRAASVMETLEQVRTQDPVPPSRLQPKLPRDLETICLKCLSKEPRLRYWMATELADDLQRFLEGQPIHARPIGPVGRAVKLARRRPALVGFIAASVLALLALVGTGLFAMLYRTQRLEQQLSEEQRSNQARAEVRALLAQGRFPLDQNPLSAERAVWEKARDLIQLAHAKSGDEAALADLRPEVEQLATRIDERLAALDRLRTFARQCDDTRFHALIAGMSRPTERQALRRKADEALALVGLSLQRAQAPNPGPAFTADERAGIVAGCFELYLIVAEAEAQPLPGQDDAGRRRQAQAGVDLLDRAARLGLETQAFHLRRARYLGWVGDTEAARKEREQAAAREPATALDFYLVGDELYRQGEPAQAVRFFDRTLELQRGHFWAQYFLAICQLQMQRPEVARANLNACLEKRPDLVWPYLMRGYAHGQLHDYAAAEADFRKALDLQPDEAATYALYNNRAVIRIGRQQLAEGMADLREAIRLMPTQYQAYVSLAKAHQQQKQPVAALAQFNRAIVVAEKQAAAQDLEPQILALLYRNRARLHLERQDRAAALRDFDRAIVLEPASSPALARTHGERGRLLQAEGRHADALVAFDRAIALHTDHIDTYRWRAETLLHLRRFQEGIACLDEYLAMGGKPIAEVYQERGRAKAQLDNYPAAVEDFTRALELQPKDGPLYVERGRAYLVCKAYQLAERDFDRAVQLDPNNADAYGGRGLARAKLGRTAEATADAEELLRRGAKTASVWHQAARLYAQAVGNLDADGQPRDAQPLRRRSQYQERALDCLRQALQLLPEAERKTFWRSQVRTDGALAPIRRAGGFVDLDEQYGPPAGSREKPR